MDLFMSKFMDRALYKPDAQSTLVIEILKSDRHTVVMIYDYKHLRCILISLLAIKSHLQIASFSLQEGLQMGLSNQIHKILITSLLMTKVPSAVNYCGNSLSVTVLCIEWLFVLIYYLLLIFKVT